jgi:hypothetical protein
MRHAIFKIFDAADPPVSGQDGVGLAPQVHLCGDRFIKRVDDAAITAPDRVIKVGKEAL